MILVYLRILLKNVQFGLYVLSLLFNTPTPLFSATQWKSDKQDLAYEIEPLNEIYKGLKTDYANLELAKLSKRRYN